MDVLHNDLIPMVVSLILGTLVGFERQMGRKPAGLRTHVLVCLGSTMFVLTTVHAARAFGGTSLDPTRIIRTEGYVHGLTTAASVWMVSAIGVAVGCYAYPLALIGTVLALIVLEVF